MNLVFTGSGTKFPIYIGFLKAIEGKIEVEKCFGTSGGALVSGLWRYGYSPDELEKMVYDVDFGKLIKLDLLHYLLGFFRGYLVSNKKIVKILLELTKGKKLEDLENVYFSAVDLVQDKSIWLCKENYGDMTIAEAIMASICIPGIFEPVRYKDMVLVDGGIRNDLMLQTNVPTILVWVKGLDVDPGEYKTIFDVLFDSVYNLTEANIEKVIKNHRESLIRVIEVQDDLPFTKFDITKEDKDRLLKKGYQAGEELLQSFIKE